MSRAVVDAKEFSHAMSKVSKILKKCAIPILEEVCLRIQNGRCTLTATDLETWFTVAFYVLESYEIVPQEDRAA